MSFEVECVFPQEERRLLLEPGHRITRSDADRPILGFHTHEIDLELRPRLRIPGREQSRVECDAVT